MQAAETVKEQSATLVADLEARLKQAVAVAEQQKAVVQAAESKAKAAEEQAAAQIAVLEAELQGNSESKAASVAQMGKQLQQWQDAAEKLQERLQQQRRPWCRRLRPKASTEYARKVALLIAEHEKQLRDQQAATATSMPGTSGGGDVTLSDEGVLCQFKLSKRRSLHSTVTPFMLKEHVHRELSRLKIDQSNVEARILVKDKDGNEVDTSNAMPKGIFPVTVLCYRDPMLGDQAVVSYLGLGDQGGGLGFSEDQLKEHGNSIKKVEEAARFSKHDGFISKGGDMHVEVMTCQDAEKKCVALPGCKGFCHGGPPTDDAVEIMFKGKWDIKMGLNKWTSYKMKA